MEILILITGLIFYALGRFSGREVETVKDLKKAVKKKLNPPHAGPIDYATPEQVEYDGSEQEKIDEVQGKLIREQLKL